MRWVRDVSTDGPILRHVKCKKWLIPMLNDVRRNALYELAIGKIVNEADSNNNGNCILDIGTGTGLLAMMGAGFGSGDVTVTSVEMSSPMASLAQDIISANGLTVAYHDIHSQIILFSIGDRIDRSLISCHRIDQSLIEFSLESFILIN